MTHPLLDANTSVWELGRPARDPCPKLEGAQRADVAIIGAGFTGISTAWHLIERFPDLGVVVLEAGKVASGASGRNGGMMLTSRHGFEGEDLEHAAAYYRATVEGIETIGEMLEAASAQHLWRREGSLDVFTDAAGAEAAAAECARLAEVGVPLEFLDAAATRARMDLEGVHGAELDPNSGQLDGVGMIEAMLPLLTARGVRVFEHSPVTRVDEGSTCRLTTPGGTVEAPAIVLATNAYTRALGYFRYSVVALHSHVLGSDPLTREQWAERGWRQGLGFADDAGRVTYGAVTPQGHLVFGGGSNASYSYLFGSRTAYAGDPTPALDAVRAKLRAYAPKLDDLPLPHAWTGPIGLTLDRIPTMGVRGAHRNVYYALGFSGHGVTLANLAGKVIRDLYSKDAARWQGLPFYQRRPYFVPGEPFTWVGYNLFTRLTGRSPRRRLRPPPRR